MTDHLAESDLVDAASRATNSPRSLAWGAAGSASKVAEWEAVQEKVARAILADPDLVTYFAYLSSNRLCTLAQKVAKRLSDMASSAEGQKYKQDDAPQPSQLRRALSKVAGRDVVTDGDVAEVTALAADYVTSALMPRTTRGGRVQQRGSEATVAYQQGKEALPAEWSAFRSALSATLRPRSFTPSSTRQLAVKRPAAALSASVESIDQSALLSAALQIAAAGAALSAAGRPADLEVRLRVGEDDFPGGVVATPSVEGGFVTSIVLSVSPVLLGIKSGDIVEAPIGEAQVLTVGASSISLRSSDIQGLSPSFRVVSAPYRQWKVLSSGLSALLRDLPAESALLPEIQRREGTSAASLRDLMEYLCGIAQVIDAASSASISALERVGGELRSYADSTASLSRAFSPLFGQTAQVGRNLLDELESRGFDYAVDLLYQGQVDFLLSAEVEAVSRAGRVGAAAQPFGAYVRGAT